MHHSKSRPGFASRPSNSVVWVLGFLIGVAGCADPEGARSRPTTSDEQGLAGGDEPGDSEPGDSEPGDSEPGDSEPGVVPDPEPATSEWEYPTQACRDLLERYRERLASASGACSGNSDCARYGGVDPREVCGGVTDASTAQSLRTIRSEMDTADCPALPYSCPAFEPSCQDARCVTGPL